MNKICYNCSKTDCLIVCFIAYRFIVAKEQCTIHLRHTIWHVHEVYCQVLSTNLRCLDLNVIFPIYASSYRVRYCTLYYSLINYVQNLEIHGYRIWKYRVFSVQEEYEKL